MPSFDIVSEVDSHELTNAVDQANRELGNRFDFKGVDAKFVLEDKLITQSAPSDFQLKQMDDILRARLIARGIDAPCSCFGTARKEPVSTNEIVRNGMLAGLAVLATAAHGAAGWPGLPHLVIVTVLTAMGRVILAIADLRRGGNRIFPDMPGRA